MAYYLIAVAAVILDRIVKYLVVENMAPWESIPIIKDVFHFTYVQNQGAAFSLWEQQWVILIGFPAAAVLAGFVLMFFNRKNWSRCMMTAVAFICGGGLGNLIDRITAGYVVDIFDFRVFPVFNIADIFICVGCGLMILDVLILERKNARHE